MTQEEKDLVIKDLCGRLPYGVIVQVNDGLRGIYDRRLVQVFCDRVSCSVNVCNPLKECICIDSVKPYLRPMRSMTKEEKDDLLRFFSSLPLRAMYFNSDWGYVEVFRCIDEVKIYINDIVGLIDWLNKNMFDYRGLIKKGLALEAPEGMYNN